IERVDGHQVAETLVQPDSMDRTVTHGRLSLCSMRRTVTGKPGLKRPPGSDIATLTPKSRSARSSSASAVRVTYSACGFIATTRPTPATPPSPAPLPDTRPPAPGGCIATSDPTAILGRTRAGTYTRTHGSLITPNTTAGIPADNRSPGSATRDITT